MIGPLRRAWVGMFIYSMGVVFTLIPVVDWVMLPLLGWWAVADFYDYDY